MKVRGLLTDESKWTKGTFARNAAGVPTFSTSPDAVCWCIAGAIGKCYSPTDAVAARNAVIGEIDAPAMFNWNDDPSRTFAEVRALIEKLDI